jgi:hypothetical protein
VPQPVYLCCTAVPDRSRMRQLPAAAALVRTGHPTAQKANLCSLIEVVIMVAPLRLVLKAERQTGETDVTVAVERQGSPGPRDQRDRSPIAMVRGLRCNR